MEVYRKAAEESGHCARSPLRVLDLGCGSGDGYRLLKKLEEQNPNHINNIEYFGLDNDPTMIKTGQQLYPNVAFMEGDFREDIPSEAWDIYLSAGVPYSHLSPTDFFHTLRRIFSNIRRKGTRSAIVIDVLGRYSIEWVSNWHLSRWLYNMSFFASSARVPPFLMTFYDSMDLKRIICNAAMEVGCHLRGIDFFDRSIMVGRHTSTKEFNPHIPRFRNLVNSLLTPDSTTDLCQLLFACKLGSAPQEVISFFERFSTAWNRLVRKASESCGERIDYPRSGPKRVENPSDRHRASVIEPALAESLRSLEATAQPGLGVGHSLIALAYAEGKAY